MATTPNPDVPAARLNPFAFPSDTDLRFVLLMVSVVGSTMFIYSWLANLSPGATRETLAAAECLALYPPLGDLFGPNRADASASIRGATDCQVPYWRLQAIWSFGGVFAVLSVAAITYWFMPAWRRRQLGLVPLDPEDASDVIDELTALSQQAGLRRPPAFLIAQHRRTTTGVTFGRAGARTVALDAGLVTLAWTDPPAFRAVVRHELAHIRNADVDKTYLTIAVCIGFAVAGVLPFLISLVGQALVDVANMGGRVFVLALLVSLTGAAVLRSRELYADVRAAIWDGPSGALRRILDRSPESPRHWYAQWAMHPPARERRALLDDTRPLFGLGFWPSFATGIAATVALPTILKVLGWLTLPWHNALLAPTFAALLFAPLLVGIAGTSVWRATFAALAQQRPLPGIGRPAVGLTLGLLLGQLLSLEASIGLLLIERPIAFVSYKALLGAALLVTLVGFLGWVRDTAVVWLEASAGSRSPRSAYLAGLAAATLALAFWIALLFGADNVTVESAGPIELLLFTGGTAYLLVMDGLLLVPALAMVWLWPMAALLRREQAVPVSEASWAHLPGPSSRALTPRDRIQLDLLRPRTALLPVLAVVLLYGALLIGLRLTVRGLLTEDVRDSAQFRLVFGYAMFGLGVLLQVLVAFVVAVRAARFGVVHGAFTACIAGGAMSVGFLAINVSFGGTVDLSFARTVFLTIAGWGALLALPSAAAGAAIRGRLRGRATEPHPTSATPAPA